MAKSTAKFEMQEPSPPAVVNDNPGSGWSFLYEGPIKPIDNRNCELCNAASMKKCGKDDQRHGQNKPNHCSSCQAARVGHCHNHCGIDLAMAMHTQLHKLSESEVKSFEQVKLMIIGYLMTLPNGGEGKSIYAKVNNDQERPNWPLFALLNIQISVW